jgi:hypothetical protein
VKDYIPDSDRKKALYRRNFTVGALEGDAFVHAACEVGDAVLEVVVCNLHDV